MVSNLKCDIEIKIQDTQKFELFLKDNIIRLNELIFVCDGIQYGYWPPFILEWNVLNENYYESKLVLFFEKIFEKYGTNAYFLYESSNEAFNFEARTTDGKLSVMNSIRFIFEKYKVNLKQFIYFSGDMNTENKTFDFTQLHSLFMFHHNNFEPIEWNPVLFDKKFLFLNNQPKEERYLLYKNLKENNILNDSFYSFNACGNPKYSESISLENTIISDEKWNDLSDYYKKSFCSIITESAYFSNNQKGACYNSISITEKTARALCNLHPFIIVSGKGSLKFLKSIGIQTFSDFWDESYDDEIDDYKRLEKIMNTIKYIHSLDYDKLNNIYLYMKDRLINNRDIFIKFKNKKYNHQYFFPKEFKNIKAFL